MARSRGWVSCEGLSLLFQNRARGFVKGGDMIGLTTTWVLECLSAEVDSMTEGVETKGEGMHVGA